MTITPKDFVERWGSSQLREQQAAQSHFNELCQLVGHKTPTQLDPEGTFFTFEENVTKATGGKGRADVWLKGHFAWEYKGKHKDLDAAYAQLSAYRGALDNPPLLVVCDFLEYRIYPQWTNSSALPFIFRNDDLLQRDAQNFIRWLLEDPNKFLELREAELRKREQITLNLANKFAHLADLMAKHKDAQGQQMWDTMRIARFLTKLVFALFAEDVGLLPPMTQEKDHRFPILDYIATNAAKTPRAFVKIMYQLFEAMDGRVEDFYMQPIPYFNGSLFADSALGIDDGLEVLDLTQIVSGVEILREVSRSDWRQVNPTIFGTMFEAALDPAKRAQLGAHYTSEADIRLVVEPVLMQPLYRLWDELRVQAEPLLQTYLTSAKPRERQTARETLIALHDRMMNTLENTRVLDPACGSGNFLYVSLRSMKDLEAQVRKFFEPLNLPFRDVVTPRQLYGIEKDVFAAKLAHIVVWIGYLQWRYEDDGGILRVPNPIEDIEHPRDLELPILRDKLSPDEPDRFINDDAILRYDAKNAPYEPEWPTVDVIVGNPPFLGDKKMRGEFEDEYIDDLRELYGERIPGQSDLVCYWFEKARAQIEMGRAKRAGLLATNSIRGGANRTVLERIRQSGDIFYAWADRPWLLAGAAVRISIVGFDDGSDTQRSLDNQPTSVINADLTPSVDLTQAYKLMENPEISFVGVQPGGAFDMPEEEAKALINKWYRNVEVLRPYYNAADITGRWSKRWIIDFGTMKEEKAAEYTEIFERVVENVKPGRMIVNRKTHRDHWWLHQEPRPGMRERLRWLERYIVTPMTAKHRVFTWLPKEALSSNLLVVIARDDDYFFGVLHSRLHEVWVLRLGTSLEDRPRYSPSSTFETFPFPYPPFREDKESPAYAAVSAAAQQLHEEREVWLNPPELIGENAGLGASDLLKRRTLTNLYNALEEYRARKNGNGENNAPRRPPTAAEAFAPRLAELHDALDRAVCDAYGWPHSVLDDEEEMLRHLLALNLQRARGASSA